jgi:hypothetical protein
LCSPVGITTPRCTLRDEAAATAGPRLTNACATGQFQRRRDHGFGFGLPANGSHPAGLPDRALSRRRPRRAGRQNRPELEISWPAKPRQRARDSRGCRILAPGCSGLGPRQAQRD